MTLTQLANFVRIVEMKSLSKAAAMIRIAQPALSRQVRALETEFGSPLLIRHGWGVTPTAAGEVLLVHARRLLRDAEAAREAVQALAVEPAGRVGLGVPPSLARCLLPPLAAALHKRFPALRPAFVDSFSAGLHERTLGGDLDLAVLYDGRAIGPLATSPLLQENLVLVGPAGEDTAAALKVLGDLPLVLPTRPNRLRMIVEGALAQDAAPTQPVAEVDSLAAIIGMVAGGQGYTLLPYSSVSEEVEAGLLAVADLPSPQMSRTLLVARPTDRTPTASVAAVEQEIRVLVQALAARLRWTPLFELGQHIP